MLTTGTAMELAILSYFLLCHSKKNLTPFPFTTELGEVWDRRVSMYARLHGAETADLCQFILVSPFPGSNFLL